MGRKSGRWAAWGVLCGWSGVCFKRGKDSFPLPSCVTPEAVSQMRVTPSPTWEAEKMGQLGAWMIPQNKADPGHLWAVAGGRIKSCCLRTLYFLSLGHSLWHASYAQGPLVSTRVCACTLRFGYASVRAYVFPHVSYTSV